MNQNKSILLGTLMASSFLVGCSNDVNKDVEVVDEFIVSEDTNILNSTTSNNDDNNESSEVDKNKETLVEENTQKEEVSLNKDNNSGDKESLKENISSNTTTDKITSNSNTISAVEKEEIKIEDVEDNIVLVENPVFEKSEITEDIQARMEGKSMKENDSISYNDLSYLTITYLDYNGNTVQGEMVVHKKLADEVLDIFRDIYYAKFPIERMNLVDDYNAVDHTSMINNNSSAFCYRTIAGTSKVSNHGMGLAIDINPFYNPHVLKSSGTVNPPEAAKYSDRSLSAKGMIKKNDAVYNAFVSRGWTWGGNWNNPDYQHFEKKI